MGGENSYKAFTGVTKKNWQRGTKIRGNYSEKVGGSGVSADKLNFMKEFASFQDLLSVAQGAIAGGVEGIIGSVGSKFSSVFQDTAGNILQNAGDTVQIPSMKKINNVSSATGNVFSAGGNYGERIASGAISGPNFINAGKTYADVARPNIADVSGALPDLPTVSDHREAFRPGQNQAFEGDNSTANRSVQGNSTGNPLLDFETMNYVLTLSCVPMQSYNNGSYKSNPGVVIAKTGGKGKQGTGPLSYDYYMERLTVRSTVASTENAFATNAYSIYFDITEPYGVDLIPALIEASQSQGYHDHLSAVYLITIDFVGNDDNGVPQKISGVSRHIPIRLYQVDLVVDEGGTKYTIQAAPYNYLQQMGVYDSLQESVVHAGTNVKSLVQDFFTELNENNKRLVDDVGALVNLYELDMTGSVAKILESKLGFDDPGASANQAINISSFGGAAPPNLRGSRKVIVEKKTSIVEYLTHVVQNSKFMLGQFDQTDEATSDILSTIKIMVTTEIINLDNGAGLPQYKFKYALRQQKVATESANVAPVRTYNYFYTGKNKDVLNLDLKYNLAYFQQGRYYDAFQNKLKNDDLKRETEALTQQAGKMGMSKDASQKFVSQSLKSQGFTVNADASGENREMADVFREILENPNADLIIVDLSILGDPYWIEQKTVQPNNNQMTSDGQTEPDGSVSPDANNIIVQINAKYPSDLDDETGLMKLDQSAFFQGKFRVFLCESNFEGGVFQNTLTMARFKGQENDKKSYLGVKDPTSNVFIPGVGKFTSADAVRESFRGVVSTSNVVNKVKSASNGIGRKSSPVAQKSIPRLNFNDGKFR